MWLTQILDVFIKISAEGDSDMNMTAQAAQEVIDGMKRDGMPEKTQKKFLKFALRTRGHLFPSDAVAIYTARIEEL